MIKIDLLLPLRPSFEHFSTNLVRGESHVDNTNSPFAAHVEWLTSYWKPMEIAASAHIQAGYRI